MKYLLTCNPGLEDVTWREASEEIPGSRLVEERRGRGRVIVEAPPRGEEHLYRMRSIHSAALLLVEEPVGYTRRALELIESITRESGVHRFIPWSSTFAVRGERIGEGHEYTSVDVARHVGKAVQEAYEAEYGVKPEVKLESPGVSILAEVDDDLFRLGVYLIGERSWHRRGYRVYDHPAALKPSLAYGLLRLAGASDSTTILDPMCGGGTVAVEAAYLYEDARIVCIDKNPRHIKGAVMNASAARVEDKIEFYVWDARRLEELLGPGSVDYVASNPPYGIRLGSPWSVRSLYSDFIPSLYKVMAGGGRASLVTTESGYLAGLARKVGFRIVHARKVRHGDLWVSLLVLEKS